MLPYDAKSGEWTVPNSSFRPKATGKTQRPPTESYEWYISFVINGQNEVECRSSTAMKVCKAELLDMVGVVMKREFNQHIQGLQDGQNIQQVRGAYCGNNVDQACWHGCFTDSCAMCLSGTPRSYSTSSISKKRHREDSPSLGNDVQAPPLSSISNAMVPSRINSQPSLSNHPMTGSLPLQARSLSIKVNETERWEEWFRNGFRAIQQQTCRLIAKEWIKLIHPKKQSTHPYNGNFPRQARASPERTKPPYWPEGVRHKEPDHIDKNDRLTLLVHLLMQTPLPELTTANPESGTALREITAFDFLQVLRKKKDEIKEKWDIVEVLIDVRTQLERFQAGGSGEATQITVDDFDDCSRAGESGKRSRAKLKAGLREKQDLSKGSEEHCATTCATRPVSPAEMGYTPVQSDLEDDKSSMHMSFGSCTSQPSTAGPSRPSLHSNLESGTVNPVQGLPPSGERHILADPTQQHAHMDLSNHAHMNHGQSAAQHPWSVAAATDHSLDPSFANGMITPQVSETTFSSLPFSHLMYQGSRSSLMNMGPSVPYQNHNPYSFEYASTLRGEMSHLMGHDASFDIQNSYSRI